jgi:hypothetical protein
VLRPAFLSPHRRGCFKNLCKPPCCRPEPYFLSPRALFCRPEPLFSPHRAVFFVAPRRKPRGPSAFTCLWMTQWKMSPRALFLSPRVPFMSPRGVSRGVSPWRRRPERSEGCLAHARQDKVEGDFLNSLRHN